MAEQVFVPLFNLENYKVAIEKELNRMYPNHPENQQLMRESEPFFPLYWESNYSPSEAVAAMISGL